MTDRSYGLNTPVPPKSLCCNLIPRVLLLGGGVLQEVIRSWGWRKPSWIGLLARELACCFCTVRMGREVSSLHPEREFSPETDHADTLTSDFRLPEPWDTVISHSVYRTLLQQVKLRQTCSEALLQCLPRCGSLASFHWGPRVTTVSRASPPPEMTCWVYSLNRKLLLC